jgi:tetraacyldisaccharide 4'-kinase
VVLFYALFRVVRDRAYLGTLRERLGFLPADFQQSSGGAIWVHAVSVGEVMAAGTLMSKLRALNAPIFVSATTLAGYAAARKRLGAEVAGCFYAPIDFANVIRRVLNHIQPALVIVFETEIWPNLFREVKRAGCGLMIANGRISDRAFPVYQKRRWFFQNVLFWPDVILAQDQQMLERFIAAGADPDRVRVSGNLKYDFEPRAADAKTPLVEWLGADSGPVWIAASTTADGLADEDDVVLDAFSQMPAWRLILAPRRPERFDPVARKLEARGIPYWRRTRGEAAGNVLLLDTIGDLPSLFGLADVVFMGGTLNHTGGHNFLEPAFAGKPVVVGPHLENFRKIAEEFRAQGAFIEIQSGAELSGAVVRALGDQATGERGRACAIARRGALEVTSQFAVKLYAEALFCRRKPFPIRWLLWPLTVLWGVGARVKGDRQLRKQRHLHVPVISIGNITAGGTGKTPFALELARRFRERGLEPVVLTRGHGRISPHSELVVRRGGAATVWHTGDEPQILLRSGVTGLGIGLDRYRAGLQAEQALKPDVFLLDDGFTHRRLARDVDVVLIDALDPIGGGELIPLGKLREPLRALGRADVFVLTRCDFSRDYRGIGNALRRWNARAPVFRSRLVSRGWAAAFSNESAEVPERVVAFCGLGNPDSFWKSLRELGIQPLDRLSFGDHHQYSPRELTALARYAESLRAKALVTTEKDVVNFPVGSEAIFTEMPVLWLRVGVEIEKEGDFMKLVSAERKDGERGA